MPSDAAERPTSAAEATRPILVYDGTCGFCWRSALRLQGWTGDALTIRPYQAFDFSQAPAGMTREACERAVHLVEADGTVRRGADACVAAFGHAPGRSFVGPLFRALPVVPRWAEAVYGVVAQRRIAVSRWVKRLAGPDPTPPGFVLGRRAFVLLMGLAHLFAAWAMASEAEALFGPDGLMPMAGFFPEEGADVGVGLGSGFETPSLFWFGTGLAAIYGVLALWFVGGLTLLTGFAPRLGLFAALVGCLSFSATAIPPTGVPGPGNPFVGYQWDGLLIEASFLGLFLVPGGLRPGAGWRVRPAWTARFLIRLLLARALFLEAWVRSISVTWQQGDSMDLHLWTQRLPTSWALDLQGSFGADLLGWIWFVVGWGAPVLLFLPRRLRLVGVVLVLVGEWARFLTGVTGVYPLVLGACALLAVDDLTFKALLPRGLACRWMWPVVRPVAGWRVAGRWLAAVSLTLIALHVSWRFVGDDPEPSSVQDLVRRFQICNGYAPFPDVEPSRPVLVLEVQDAEEAGWRQLEPRQATGAALALPPWPSLAFGRFDWELGGAARSAAFQLVDAPWFDRLQSGILSGVEPILGLFEPGSFPEGAPLRARARLFGYRPAGAEARAGGQGWDRQPSGLESPPLELRDGVVTPVGR